MMKLYCKLISIRNAKKYLHGFPWLSFCGFCHWKAFFQLHKIYIPVAAICLGIKLLYVLVIITITQIFFKPAKIPLVVW